MTQTVQERAIQTATRLVDDLMSAEQSGKPKIWRKMSTIMSMMESQRLTAALKATLAAELNRNGITTDPPLEDARRSTTIRLFRRNQPEPQAASTESDEGQLSPGVECATAWINRRPQNVLEWLPKPHDPDGFVVIELDRTSDPEEIRDTVAQWLSVDLSLSLAATLISPQRTSAVQSSSDLNAIHLALVGADVPKDEGQRASSAAPLGGSTILQPVDLLIGPTG